MKTSVKIGQLVRFHDRVFSPLYTPYYDSYKGHLFKVVAIHPGNLLWLKAGGLTMLACGRDDDAGLRSSEIFEETLGKIHERLKALEEKQ